LSANTERNAGGSVSASSLQYPSGIWTDGQKLIVADAWNHRVLVWHHFPTVDGQVADVVIGQPDFLNNLPNVKGLTNPPNAQSLYWCYGVWSDGKSLWIADTGNRRVLYYETIPTKHFAKADAVIGQESFNEREYTDDNAVWPYSIKISPEGAMAINDSQCCRVLIWKHWKDAFSKKADVLIGQSTFLDNSPNQLSFMPKDNSLHWNYDSCFYKKGIFINDTANSRVLWFKNIPVENNMSADNLIGQKDFVTGSENRDTVNSTENTLYWPFSLSEGNNCLAVADTGNHRIALLTLDQTSI